MADSKGGGIGGFPWASVAVMVAFVASTQLVPHAFEPLRPAEKARAQSALDPDLEINARLWEDPFAALRRYESDWAARCDSARKAAAGKDDVNCGERAARARDPRALLARLDGDRDRNLDNTLIILGLMPGADFVGAEEARRRIRYATLAGLLAMDYVPENAERLSLLEFDLLHEGGAPGARAAASAPAAGHKAGFMVPYERLSLREPGRAAGKQATRYAQVALLWVDETALPVRKLNAIARLTEQVMGHEALTRARFKLSDTDHMPHLAVIGPSSTDALRVALRDLQCAADLHHLASLRVDKNNRAYQDAAQCATDGTKLGAGLPDDVYEGYRLLSRAEFFNSSSTAPSSTLVSLDPYHENCSIPANDTLNRFLTHQFSRLTQQKCQVVQMVRTVGKDAALITSLLHEIGLRIPADSERRIVLVAERDSLYAQSLVAQLMDGLPKPKGPRARETVKVIYFFRGIDGVTTTDNSPAPSQAAAAKSATPTLEWPESRDQLDYLRRLGAELKRSEADPELGAIGAIGIFANDVHDKLLVLQALHEEFSDRMFFTTDMDARYLHPRTQAFTRNLVVASSLPLSFYPPQPAKGQPIQVALDLQAGTPPLRDIYQTSTFAAARQAGCRGDDCKRDEQRALKLALDHPSVYEIGRSNSVPLSGYAIEAQPRPSSTGRVFAALMLMAVIGCTLFIWPSTPAIRQMRRAVLPVAGPRDQSPVDATAVPLVALHAALLSFAAASLLEFVRPGHLAFMRVTLLTGLTASAMLLLGLTALRATPSHRLRRAGHVRQAILLALIALWLWLAWPGGGWQAVDCENCEPLAWLEGVSAWPSHLIHLLALFVVLWTMDWAWADTQAQLWRDSDWLRLPRPQCQPGVLRLLRDWSRRVSVLYWKPGVGFSCDFEVLWQEYAERGEAAPRIARALLWCGLAMGLMLLMFFSLSEGQIPEIPVRGHEHRQLVRAGLYAILLLLPLLIVAVADATLLLTRFVRHLNAGRSFYPDATIQAFSRALGEEQQALWAQRFCARPEERNKSGEGFAVHTLLDDWIDVQVVARRSAPIARLVIGPFVVLALLVVARSRLFDNWALTPAIAVGVSCYVAILIGLTILLKQAAETTRARALESMQADLRWLAGSGKPLSDLVEPFKRLIAQVEANQSGAFASFFDQPLLKAMLVPLGGAGGTQLFDYLLLGR